MYARPSTFKRSSENTKDGDRQAAAETARYIRIDAEIQKREDELESRSYGIGGGMAAAGVVRKPTWDEVHGREYDLEGAVRP